MSKVTIGQQFNLTVIVNAGSGKPVDAVQVYLDFDATVLKAVDITTGTVLSEELQSQIDNSLGQVDYAAGTLGAAVKSPFHLATIRFRALAASGQSGTNVRFAFLENPRRSKSVTAGFDNTGSLGSITLIAE